MKHLFPIFLLILIISKSYSQDTIYLKNVDDTLSVPKENASYYKVIDSKVYPIEISTYYINGVGLSKEHFSSITPKVRNGEYESYFYNGKINVKGIFKDNKMEGSWIAYNKEKGFIESKLSFKENQKNGKGFIFYENGKLKRMETYLRDTLVLLVCYDTTGSVIECNPVDTSQVYEKAEIMPGFPNGGTQALMKFLFANIKYPKNAREAGLQGKVVVKFIINTDGSIESPMIVNNNAANYELEKEAIRVISSMPKWIPASQQGKKVRVYFVLPITFKLDELFIKN